MKNAMRRLAAVAMTVLCMTGMSFAFNGAPLNTAQAEAPKEGETYIVKVGKLNLRSGPGTRHKSEAKLKKGTEVTFQKALKNWWYVNYPKGNGYVDSQYLEKKSLDAGIVVTADTKAANTTGAADATSPTHVTTTRVRLRFKPTSKSKAMGWLEKDSNVTVLSKKGKWSQIPFHERKVWVCSKYLEKLQQNQ